VAERVSRVLCMTSPPWVETIVPTVCQADRALCNDGVEDHGAN